MIVENVLIQIYQNVQNYLKKIKKQYLLEYYVIIIYKKSKLGVLYNNL